MDIKKFVPAQIKNTLKRMYAMVPLPSRYGPVFSSTYDFLRSSQYWSAEKLADYQFYELKRLLAHAESNVPYYRSMFKRRRFSPAGLGSIKDLANLEFLTKDIIRENMGSMMAENMCPGRFKKMTTGGSSGLPLSFYCDEEVADAREWAFVWRQWNWAGYYFGNSRIVLRGNIVKRQGARGRRTIFYEPLDNALVLSSYDMSPDDLAFYARKIKDFRPRAVQGYPSSLYALALYCGKMGIRFDHVKCVLTSSETLYRFQRELIESVFMCKVYDHYGHTERAALIMQCEGSSYHVIPEYGVMELVDEYGAVIDEPGVTGEIVATGFNNYAMPFIRYRTGDMASYGLKECSCGRNFRVIEKIEGRQQDFVYLSDGTKIALTALVFAQHFDAFSRIAQLQFHQEVHGELNVRIVKGISYGLSDESEFRDKLNSLCGDKLAVRFEYVSDIPRSPRGKHLFMVQEIR